MSNHDDDDKLDESPDEADERTECVEDVSVISTRLRRRRLYWQGLDEQGISCKNHHRWHKAWFS